MTHTSFASVLPRRGLPRALALMLLAAALVLLSGCAETGQMADQARYDTYEASTLFADGRSARPFQPGTVPFDPQGNPDDAALTGLDEAGDPVAQMPVEVDQELLLEGRERYQIFCVPCHGVNGDGNGNATLYKFPKPPPLIGGTELSDGQIFTIIENGQGIMFPYGYRVKPHERWAIVAYIRAMQAQGGAVNPADLTPEQINQIGGQQ